MTTCQGCDEHLNYEKQKPPYNIVFKWNGFQKWPKFYGSKEWVIDKQQSQCFFYLHEFYCIKSHIKDPKCESLYMMNAIFRQLNKAHVEVLK